MESVSGCKLPFSLKLKISKLIDEHCFNCGLSVNMDINSLGNVSKEFQDMFAKMFRHICKTDVRTKDLVLDIMKAIAETDPSVDDGAGSYGAAVPPNVADSISDGAPEEPNVVAPKVCFFSIFSIILFLINYLFTLLFVSGTCECFCSIFIKINSKECWVLWY
jgi:hypothetical protein